MPSTACDVAGLEPVARRRRRPVRAADCAQPPALDAPGWARSQGIFRHQDRSLIQDYFEDRGIEPGDHIEPMRLVSGLESWLLFHRRDGGRLLTLLRQDDAVRDVLADPLESGSQGGRARSRDRWRRGAHAAFSSTTTGRAFSLALTVTPDLEGTTIDVGGQAGRTARRLRTRGRPVPHSTGRSP